MPLSWNEIKSRALAFAKEWEHESSEDAEAKSFWDSFFDVFGISRRRVASFETPVKKADAKQGFIDLLWKGNILVEHKSRGKDLDKAVQQAKDYFPGLKEHELPKYILVSDFQRFRLYDPVTMPPDLVKAHTALDRAVDLCYRPQAFTSELSRIEYLFGLYEQYTAPMFGGESKKAGKKRES